MEHKIKQLGNKIAIAGKMASGKSTLANLLVEKEQFRKFSFATGVKHVATQVFGMTIKDRDLLIQIGNKMREIDPQVWIKYLLREAENTEKVVVDDLRYPNEYIALRNAGFKIIYLNISNEEQLLRLQKTYPSTWQEHVKQKEHFTETQLSPEKMSNLEGNFFNGVKLEKMYYDLQM